MNVEFFVYQIVLKYHMLLKFCEQCKSLCLIKINDIIIFLIINLEWCFNKTKNK